MVLVKAKVRQWGSSLGVIIPKAAIRKMAIERDQEVVLDIKKRNPLEEVFGSVKGWDIDPQKVKDELRKEWSKW